MAAAAPEDGTTAAAKEDRLTVGKTRTGKAVVGRKAGPSLEKAGVPMAKTTRRTMGKEDAIFVATPATGNPNAPKGKERSDKSRMERRM